MRLIAGKYGIANIASSDSLYIYLPNIESHQLELTYTYYYTMSCLYIFHL